MIGAGSKIGPDLRGEHPIGFTYDAALATTDGSLKNPVTATVTVREVWVREAAADIAGQYGLVLEFVDDF